MISFIIPAHNEELLIAGTISALHSAALDSQQPYEIIVANDASTDATPTLAQNCGARVVSVNCRQIAAARNAGAAQARGDLLIFVDADTHVPGTVLVAAVRAARDGAVGGGARARFDDSTSTYGRILEWLWEWIQRFGHLAAGCFLFCTRQAFEAAGGFDQTLYASEEIGLSRRLQKLGRFVILPHAVITSARNLHAYSVFQILHMGLGFALLGPRFFKTRRGPWYSVRRNNREMM